MDSYDTHILKILPEYYNHILDKTKTFEVRNNDRDYKVNDRLLLREWTSKGYTGRESLKRISYILNNSDYCKEGFVILSIKSVN